MSFHTAQTFIFGEQPSATKWGYIWENDYALANGTGIEADAITDAKLIYGKLRSRQGGSATNWSTVGTNTYDYSAVNTFVQVGSKLINANPTTITFPTAFNQVPLLFLSVNTAVSANVFPVQTSAPTTTTGSVRLVTDGGSPATTEAVSWLAIGE